MKHYSDLFIVNSFPPYKGGISHYLYGICRLLSKKRNIAVITRVTQHTESEEFSVKRAGFYNSYPILNKIHHYILSILFFFKHRNSIKRIYAGAAVPYGIMALLFKYIKPSIHVYIFTYGSELLWNEKISHYKTRNSILRKADTIITISRYSRNIIRDITDKPVYIVYPGYNGVFKSKEHHAKKHINILTVASLTKRKGQHLVLMALSKIADKLDFTYNIIGSGPEKKSLFALAEKLNISNSVNIYSGLSDNEVENYYTKSDIFIMPTYRDNYDIEGFGIVYLEAGAHSLAIIASPVGGVTDIIEHNKNGIMCPEQDIECLMTSLLKLSNDREMRNTLGKAAYNTALSFNYDDSVEKLISL